MKSTSYKALALCICLSACATDARKAPPARQWTSDKDPQTLAACIIPEMNARTKAKFPLDPDITHQIDTTLPGKEYEIRSQREITLGMDVYLVKLIVQDAGGTLIQAFGGNGWRYMLYDAVGVCLGLSEGNQSQLFKKR